MQKKFLSRHEPFTHPRVKIDVMQTLTDFFIDSFTKN